MAVYFFSDSYTYKSGVSASSSGGTDVYSPSKAIDYDMATYFENDGATPSLVIDLGVARTVDSLFLKEANITTFKLYHSPDNSNWTEVSDGTKAEKESGIWWWTAFTEVTKRYWKIEVTSKGAGNVKIHEVMLMKLNLSLIEDLSLPSMIVITPRDSIGGNYQLVDGSATSYAGSRAYNEISIEFQNISSADYDSLYELFTITPSLRYPLVIIPDDDKPSYIYRCIWADDAFNFKYSQPLKLSGFDGSMKLMEY